MSYEKKIRIRLVLQASIALCGVISIAVGLLCASRISAFSAGYFCGIGFGLTAAAMVMIVKNAAALRSSEKMRTARIREEDERNTTLSLMSSNIAFATVILLLFFGSIYYAFHNEEVVHIFAFFISVSVAVKFISYFILQKHI